jgi:hypothetical protein
MSRMMTSAGGGRGLQVGKLAGGELGEDVDGLLDAGAVGGQAVDFQAAGEELAGVGGDGGGEMQGGSHGRPPSREAEANVCSHGESVSGAHADGVVGPPLPSVLPV